MKRQYNSIQQSIFLQWNSSLVAYKKSRHHREGKTVLWLFRHLDYMYPVKATFLFGVNQGPLMKYEVLGKRNSREGEDTPGNFW